jgi:chemotaxis protein CheD
MYNLTPVGLGEIKTGQEPADVLVAYGLGSCLAVLAYDPVEHVGGMLHAVLPTSDNGTALLSSKYVDTGITALLGALVQLGVRRERLVVKLAGGANILVALGQTALFNIGTRNIAAAYDKLSSCRLKIANQEVGGNKGRTVRLYVADGRATISTLGQNEREF